MNNIIILSPISPEQLLNEAAFLHSWLKVALPPAAHLLVL